MQIQPAVASPAIISGKSGISDRIEAMFLKEMLKTSGPEKSGTAAQGGIGEEQFTSFLTDEYARILALRIDLKLGGRGDK